MSDANKQYEFEAEDSARLEFTEVQGPGLRSSTVVDAVLYQGRSQFQKIAVYSTPGFGKMLILDGKAQSAQNDEHVYHETLVQAAMIAHPAGVKKAFIGGGGEGATLREILRHKSVERVVMVDIDGEAVDVCRKELPEWSQGAFEDERTELVIGDAVAHLEKHDETYDFIVLDVSDPLECGPAVVCYTVEFYELIKRRLNPGGVFVTQSGCGSLLTAHEVFSVVNRTMREVFPAGVHPYRVNVPSFLLPWAFNMGFKDDAGGIASRVPDMTAAEVDERIAERLPGVELRHYDGRTHAGLFGLGRSLRAILENETRVSTRDNPKAFLN